MDFDLPLDWRPFGEGCLSNFRYIVMLSFIPLTVFDLSIGSHAQWPLKDCLIFYNQLDWVLPKIVNFGLLLYFRSSPIRRKQQHLVFS